MIGVLIVTSSYLIYDISQRDSDNKPKEPSPTTPVAATPVETQSKKSSITPNPRQTKSIPINAGISVSTNWGRNPFKRGKVELAMTPTPEDTSPGTEENPLIRAVQTTSEQPDLKVSVITLGNQGARALINGRVRKVGDVVEGMMIIDITGETVTLKGGGRTLILEVGS